MSRKIGAGILTFMSRKIDGMLTFYEQEKFHVELSMKKVLEPRGQIHVFGTYAKSADSVQTPRNVAASDHGQHCLQEFL